MLYGSLRLTPGFQAATGQFTYAELCRLTGSSPNTLKRAVRALHEGGWLEISQGNKFSPVRFVLRNPAAEWREAEVAAARRRLEKAAFSGEALLREYLSLIIDSDMCLDDCRPGFLVNACSNEAMRFDRYYPPPVAFDFHAPQRYGPNAGDPQGTEARMQLGLDYMKLGICVDRGITLVAVYAEDLTLESMQRKVGDLLPRRRLAHDEPLIEYRWP